MQEYKIYLDQNGRYYKALEPKDKGDAVFNVATADMFQYLTEVPITLVEYHTIILKKDVKNDPDIQAIEKYNAPADVPVSNASKQSGTSSS